MLRSSTILFFLAIIKSGFSIFDLSLVSLTAHGNGFRISIPGIVNIEYSVF